MATSNASQVQAANQQFLLNALERNYQMVQTTITQAGQVIDIELEQVSGYLYAIDLSCLFNLDVTVATGGAVPTWSSFAPDNLFSNIQVAMGGGPFINCSAVFFRLRQRIMNPGWNPLIVPSTDPAYVGTDVFSFPALQATVGSTVTNTLRFGIHIPLQIAYGHIEGHLPGNAPGVKVKLRLTVTNNLYGSNQYASPVVGGSGVTVQITPSTTAQSWVQPNLKYRSSPAVGGGLPTPTIGSVLNVQEAASAFVGAGALTPLKFPNPFRHLRLYHIVLDGTGTPNSTGVNAFELDLSPGIPQFNYNTPAGLQDYFNQVRELYKGNLPAGVFVFDLWSGSDPHNPNGTQTIDGTVYTTLQTQIGVNSAFQTAGGNIITYDEALSPVSF
ncbi:hypothetical protein SD51_12160 [Alicyclobacillus tengchongensis]|nr:hypothetical protein SD51_12160 [Alicyclobacillus tengchongensis]